MAAEKHRKLGTQEKQTLEHADPGICGRRKRLPSKFPASFMPTHRFKVFIY